MSDGFEFPVGLHDVLYISNLEYNLCSPSTEIDGKYFDYIGVPDRVMTAHKNEVFFYSKGSMLVAKGYRMGVNANISMVRSLASPTFGLRTLASSTTLPCQPNMNYIRFSTVFRGMLVNIAQIDGEEVRC